jgi:exodeoxyribonuclease-3
VLLRWLRETSPDVVCLQELKAADRDFPATALDELGYGARWVGQRSWTGVAILTKGMTPSRPGGRYPAIPPTLRAATSKPPCGAC